jgi:hypothetical protein
MVHKDRHSAGSRAWLLAIGRGLQVEYPLCGISSVPPAVLELMQRLESAEARKLDESVGSKK